MDGKRDVGQRSVKEKVYDSRDQKNLSQTSFAAQIVAGCNRNVQATDYSGRHRKTRKRRSGANTEGTMEQKTSTASTHSDAPM